MRKKTKEIFVGNMKIGGDSPISIQTMTNSQTEDIVATLRQIHAATRSGADLIRVSCPSVESTKALKEIIKNSDIPIIADIHFNYKRAIEAFEAGAHCVRINPGNIDKNAIAEIVHVAKNCGGAIRIGINSGSIEKEILDKYREPTAEAIVESAVLNAKILEDLDFFNFKISVKSSDVKMMIMAYKKLSEVLDYPLHLGVTEAGPVFSGTIKSAIGMGSLLADGIGDTIRVSLSTNDICEEIRVGRQILKSLGLLNNSVNIVSCPTCARTLINVSDIASQLEQYCETIKKNLKISVLGCVVNGVGEALYSDIGVFGFQKGIAKLYVRSKEVGTFAEEVIFEKIEKVLLNEF